MKKLLTLAMSLALAVTLTACGGAKPAPQNNDGQNANAAASQEQTETKNHLEAIKDAGKLVVSTSADYPPFEYHSIVNGKDTVVGWEMELAAAIADELGVDLEIKEGVFDTLLLDLDAGKADMVISAMTIDAKRLESVDFSNPYWMTAQSVLIAKDQAASLTKAENLSGMTIGVQLGSTGEVAAKEIAGAEVRSYDLFEAAVMDLAAGRVDAVVGDYAVVKNYAAKQSTLAVAFELTKEENAVALRKGDKELGEAVNQALAKLDENGTIDQLIEKYEVAPPPEAKAE